MLTFGSITLFALVCAVITIYWVSNNAQEPLTTTTVAKVILDSITEKHGGHPTLFGVCGAAWYPFDATLEVAVQNDDANYVWVTNEASACLAASKWSDTRETDYKIGTVLTTAGPGTTMAITGIASANKEERALVCFCGLPADRNAYGFQFVDPTIMSSVTKHMYHLDSSLTSIQSIQSVIDNAYDVARYGTRQNPGPGAVVIFVNYESWMRRLTDVPISQSLPKPFVTTGNELRAVSHIINTWNKSNMVVLRLGGRLEPETTSLVAQMATEFPQCYITLTYANRGALVPSSDPEQQRILDLDGPLGNTSANEAIAQADLVIDCGIGVIYSLLTYESKTNGSVIHLYDDGSPSVDSTVSSRSYTRYSVNVDKVLQLLVESKNKLVRRATSPYEPDTTGAFQSILDAYDALDTTSTGYAVSQCVQQFYNSNNIASDDYYHVCDVGAAGFIAGQLLRVTQNDNLILFSQFSPIGSALASAAGRIYRESKDTVVYIGDGGFYCLLSSLTDLKSAVLTSEVRCLLLIFNDQRYGNVALAEKKLFGNYTIITQTNYLQDAVSIEDIVSAASPIQSATTLDLTFIQSFRDQTTGFTDPGLYVMIVPTVTSEFVTSI